MRKVAGYPHRELSLGTFPQVALARLLHPSPSKGNTFPNVLIHLEVTLWPEFLDTGQVLAMVLSLGPSQQHRSWAYRCMPLCLTSEACKNQAQYWELCFPYFAKRLGDL